MLQIFLHGPKESGFIDLLPGTVLEMEILKEEFDDDLTLGEYSLPLDIPWTERNRRLFGFAERVVNFNKSQNYFICDIYDHQFPELVGAKITILEKVGKFTYRSGKFTASISGTKGLFGSAIQNKKMKDLVLDGPITWSGMDSRQFAHTQVTDQPVPYPYITFAPVAIEDFFDKDRTDYDGEFLAMDTVNNVVVTGSGTNNWIFGRPNSTNPAAAVASGNTEYCDYRTVPFFRLQYVLRKLFEENGFFVIGEFIDDPAFADLVIFNNYGIENYAPTINIDFNRKIVPSNHMPDMLQADFLKAVLGLFSIYPVFLDGNQVRLVFHKTDLSIKNIATLDDICNPDFESAYVDGTSIENGYVLNYTWDSNDQYYSERVKDIANKNKVATVNKVSDLDTLYIGRDFTTDDIVFVDAANMYYQVADATAVPVLWDAYSEQLDSYKKGNGDKSVDIAISTLCTYVELDSASALYVKRNYVGTRQLGSYISNKGAFVKNPFELRIFYAKLLPINGVTLPVSFNQNRNANNQKIVPYSLAWVGNDGLANFHTDWLDITQNAEIVKVDIKSTKKEVALLDKSNRFQIGGTLFLLKNIERTIPLSSTMKLSLVTL